MFDDRDHYVYDPAARRWLDDAAEWTEDLEDARAFPSYAAANIVREELEREGAYGNHELHIRSY